MEEVRKEIRRRRRRRRKSALALGGSGGGGFFPRGGSERGSWGGSMHSIRIDDSLGPRCVDIVLKYFATVRFFLYLKKSKHCLDLEKNTV